MSAVAGHRPARSTRPLTPPAPRAVEVPPTTGEQGGSGSAVQSLLPMIGAASSVTMIVVLRHGNPLFLVAGAVLLVVALAGGIGLALSRTGQAARARRTRRLRYLDHLETVRGELRHDTAGVRARAHLLDPDPALLPQLLADPSRRFERRPADPDFLRVRIGLGDRPWFGLTVPPPANPVEPYDPLLADQARSVCERYSLLRGVPVGVDLARAAPVSVVGERTQVLAVGRSMLVQLAALHAPEEVAVAVVVPAFRRADWGGADLLPHLVGPPEPGLPTGRRRVVEDAAALTALIASSDHSDHSDRSWVVLCDGHGSLAPDVRSARRGRGDPPPRITVVHLLSEQAHEPGDVGVRVRVSSDGTAAVEDLHPTAPTVVGVTALDRPSPGLVAAVTRAAARCRVPGAVVTTTTAPEVTDLLGLPALLAGPAPRWPTRSERDFLRVPIGTDESGTPVLLDLKESARLGMGPHGLCVGATGSGKSELLRTLVLGLTATHGPEDLSLVLVDYKGGAAFAPFAALPHLAGLVDNLADDPQLVQRAQTSLAGEVLRRQRQLRDAGSVPSIDAYRRLRQQGRDLPPMPHLLLVVDEFAELLTAEPDFVDLLISIGRIGRSIGVHLLLSSQRVESGRLRGLESYLSYRIALRTFSESESSAVLDTGDAFHLPAQPGHAYLKVDTTTYQRFRVGYVSRPCPAPVTARSVPVAEPTSRPLVTVLPAYDPAPGLGPRTTPGADEPTAATGSGPSLVDACVARLAAGDPRPVEPVWLAPLPSALPLGDVIAVDLPEAGLGVPLGLIDDPARQSQQPWVVDLGLGGGHLAVVGAPGSGRSTFLRTVAAALAYTHVPSEVSVYGLDLSGGGLRRIEGLPHVGGVATRGDRERRLRLLDELAAMVTDREQVLRAHALDSVGELRRRHGAGRLPELAAAEVVLLVDGGDRLRGEFDELEERVVDLLQRGSSVGVHVVLALTRWNDLRMATQPMIGTRVELRLNDPVDSLVGRRLSATLKADQPGRGLSADGRFVHVALPVLDLPTVDHTMPVGLGIERLVSQAVASWSGPTARPIRMLPTEIALDELDPEWSEPVGAIPLGVRQDTMAPEPFRLDRDQHVLVHGDSGAGKTTALETLVHGLVRSHDSDALVLAVVDPRGGLLPELPEEYVGGRARTPLQANQLLTSVAAELQQRLKSGDPDGPRIVVVVDDVDVVTVGGQDPLTPLLPYLSSARDLRLHVLLSRPVAGLSRAAYEVGLQTLRETGGTTVLLSGEPSEGAVLPGVRPEPSGPGRGRVIRRGEPPFVVQVARSRRLAPVRTRPLLREPVERRTVCA